MTVAELGQLKAGDIIHVVMEYQGRVYLDGIGVFQYAIGDNGQVSSISYDRYFSGAFHCSGLTKVSSSSAPESQEVARLQMQVAQIGRELTILKSKATELCELIK